MIFLVGVLVVAAIVQHVARKSIAARPDSNLARTANKSSTYVGWGVVGLLGVIALIILIAASA